VIDLFIKIQDYNSLSPDRLASISAEVLLLLHEPPGKPDLVTGCMAARWPPIVAWSKLRRTLQLDLTGILLLSTF
jgi:hypothetical protein